MLKSSLRKASWVWPLSYCATKARSERELSTLLSSFVVAAVKNLEQLSICVFSTVS